MNKPLRHTHKSDTDNFYPDKDLLKHQITKEHFKEITNGKNIKKVLFINPPDVDESIFDYDIITLAAKITNNIATEQEIQTYQMTNFEELLEKPDKSVNRIAHSSPNRSHIL